MEILNSDFKKGTAKLRVTELEDLWYLSQIIDRGDLVKGKTTRKIKLGSGENAKTVKKTITLKIEVEKIEFHQHSNSLRLNGKVIEGPEDIPNGSHHTIALEEKSEFKIEKKQWLDYQKEKLKEASEKKYNFLVCVFDREEAIFALSKRSGFEILTKLEGEVAKKRKQVEAKGDFYQKIINIVEQYQERYQPDSIILASPAFFKDDLIKKITDRELKSKIVLATCGSVSRNALDEILKQPELQSALKKSRFREEEILVEELLSEINKNGLAAYGSKEVTDAVAAGAVEKLLVTDSLIQKMRQEDKYEKLDNLIKQVYQLKGQVRIISAESEGGKRLKGLGGIAALLRYKLNY